MYILIRFTWNYHLNGIKSEGGFYFSVLALGFGILLAKVENNFFKNRDVVVKFCYILLYYDWLEILLKLSIEYIIYNNNRIW